MILIADSGSTKTDWCLIDKGKLVQELFSNGINPFYQTEEEKELANSKVSELISQKVYPLITTQIVAFKAFYIAEDYHQDYLDKNKNGYCHVDLTSHKNVK